MEDEARLQLINRRPLNGNLADRNQRIAILNNRADTRAKGLYHRGRNYYTEKLTILLSVQLTVGETSGSPVGVQLRVIAETTGHHSHGYKTLDYEYKTPPVNRTKGFQLVDIPNTSLKLTYLINHQPFTIITIKYFNKSQSTEIVNENLGTHEPNAFQNSKWRTYIDDIDTASSQPQQNRPKRHHSLISIYPNRCDVSQKSCCFVTVKFWEVARTTFTQSTSMDRVVVYFFSSLVRMYRFCLHRTCGT